MKSAERLPRSLKQNLIIHDLDDETRIYDMESAHAYCLNRSSALVWKYCDGRLRLAGLRVCCSWSWALGLMLAP
jgi:hypothetical protein